MLIVFQSIAPIFLLIGFGAVLRRFPKFDTGFWRGLDSLGFYLLYPVLLFITILRADFGALALGPIMMALAIGLSIVGVATLASWLVFRRAGMSRARYSSVFQSCVRWNGFIALAVAEKMFPPAGAAMVALVMAAAIIPINVASVAVVARFSGRDADLMGVMRKVVTNPLIVGCAAALVVRALPFGLPEPLVDALDLIGRAALGMGLLAIGAGLRIEDALRPPVSIAFPVMVKLVLLPVLVLGFAALLGVPDEQMVWLALTASVPTAMNGYVLAREMGGDAEYYAATATLQTVVAFVSMPAIIGFAQFVWG